MDTLGHSSKTKTVCSWIKQWIIKTKQDSIIRTHGTETFAAPISVRDFLAAGRTLMELATSEQTSTPRSAIKTSEMTINTVHTTVSLW